METIIRDVRDFQTDERCLLERVVGRHLEENQRIMIQIVTPTAQPGESAAHVEQPQPGKLPDWCNVYEGLGPDQVAEVEKAILQRSDLSRPS